MSRWWPVSHQSLSFQWEYTESMNTQWGSPAGHSSLGYLLHARNLQPEQTTVLWIICSRKCGLWLKALYATGRRHRLCFQPGCGIPVSCLCLTSLPMQLWLAACNPIASATPVLTAHLNISTRGHNMIVGGIKFIRLHGNKAGKHFKGDRDLLDSSCL